MVELSSFQLMDMKRSPQRAVVTNLAPNHLDIHKDMQEYVDAKKNMFPLSGRKRPSGAERRQRHHPPPSEATAPPGSSPARAWRYVCIEDGVICRNGKPILPTKDILIPGVHNIENYMAAITVVEGLVSDETIRHVAKTFGGVEHRIELVRVKDGVRFYNDSIASSPSRTIAGLRSFPEKVILIAGGYDKHIPYDVLGPEICAHVKKLYLGGATGQKIREAVERCPEYDPKALEIVDCGSFEPAVRAAAAAAEPGDVVLMSPASAAFDQFKNFMVRGSVLQKTHKGAVSVDITKVTRPARKLLKLQYCGAVIVAAGTASRMEGIDKVMAPLGGEPMIARTVRAFQDCDAISADRHRHP